MKNNNKIKLRKQEIGNNRFIEKMSNRMLFFCRKIWKEIGVKNVPITENSNYTEFAFHLFANTNISFGENGWDRLSPISKRLLAIHQLIYENRNYYNYLNKYIYANFFLTFEIYKLIYNKNDIVQITDIANNFVRKELKWDIHTIGKEKMKYR